MVQSVTYIGRWESEGKEKGEERKRRRE